MGKLDDAFDIMPVEPAKQQTLMLIPETEDESVEDTDFKYSRQVQLDLIEVAKAAVQTAMKVAVESENPKALEALALMIKTTSEANKQLVLQSKDRMEVKQMKKDGGGGKPSSGGNITNNIVMTGKLSDIAAMLNKESLSGN